ncbi:MAG: hypothetical protein M1839_000332 [Geoglossum umbratile]|nr:MAG: hypothetical protein M1839_000332 [Geoglossum umbratile]
MPRKDKPTSDPDPTASIPHVRAEPRPDFSKTPVPYEKLPDDLQKIVDDEDTLMDRLFEGTADDTTSTNLRYAAYGSRIRTALMSAQRYVAYTSDVAESFRPVAHPYLVRGGYAVSWAYLVGDVGYEGYRAYLRNQNFTRAAAENSSKEGVAGGKAAVVPLRDDYRTLMVQRAIFQSIASMGLPAFTIHSIVRYSGVALKGVKQYPKLRAYGPIGLGLAAVPFLPYMFDKPVEEAVDWGVGKVVGLIEGEGKGGGKVKEL